MRIKLTFLLMSLCSGSFASAATQHWTNTEKSILKSLWINSLPEKSENITNKYVFNEEAAKFGQKLFFDKRFSENGQISCSHCHQPDKYFTDALKTSKGIGLVKRNAPTIVGVSYSNWFFLDGRADSLWSQAMGPLETKLEHGGDRTMFAHILYNDKIYRKTYEKIFGKMPNIGHLPKHAAPIRDKKLSAAWRSISKKDKVFANNIFVNMTKAIAAYEHKLKPAASKFDKYVQAVLENKKGAMKNIYNADEAAGLKLFISKANCVVCHNGPMFSDYGFHNIATPPVDVKRYDWGRFKGVTKLLKSNFNCKSQYNDYKEKGCDELTYIVREKEHTSGSFRTPSLRNVTKTSPYMHAGQYKTIKDVLEHYNETPKTKIGQSDLRGLKIKLSKSERKQLEVFLKTLDSEIDADKRWLVEPK